MQSLIHPTGRLLFSLLWLATTLLGCRAERYQVATDAPTPVIDGQRKDWKEASLQTHESAPLRYAVRRDQDRLYLLLLVEDPGWQQQILMTGLTAFFAADGRSAAQRGLRYPVGLDRANQPHDPNRLNQFLGNLHANREALLGTMEGLEMIGFQVKRDTVFTDNPTPSGLHATAQFRQETLVWEMAVPKQLLPGLAQADYLRLTWETGQLGRPEQLRGSDAAGLGGTNPSNPTQDRGQSERDWLDRLDRYRSFAAPRRARVRVELPPGG